MASSAPASQSSWERPVRRSTARRRDDEEQRRLRWRREEQASKDAIFDVVHDDRGPALHEPCPVGLVALKPPLGGRERSGWWGRRDGTDLVCPHHLWRCLRCLRCLRRLDRSEGRRHQIQPCLSIETHSPILPPRPINADRSSLPSSTFDGPSGDEGTRSHAK